MAKNETTKQTVTVIGSLCLVCSIVVSVAAVGLKPTQLANKELDKQKNLLQVANRLGTPSQTRELYEQFIEARMVDLATGEFVDGDADAFDQRAAAKDPEQSTRLSAAEDIAGIGSRANVASVYLAKDEQGEVEGIILPVHGRGLWSTMYAFLNITPDGSTVKGITYYDQGETPGLGGEIANPSWNALWEGKNVLDEDGNPGPNIVKGLADPNSNYDIDGLSGATLTVNGVQASIDFWLGEQGFGPFLQNLKNGGANNG